jgi:hypothetical protein
MHDSPDKSRDVSPASKKRLLQVTLLVTDNSPATGHGSFACYCTERASQAGGRATCRDRGARSGSGAATPARHSSRYGRHSGCPDKCGFKGSQMLEWWCVTRLVTKRFRLLCISAASAFTGTPYSRSRCFLLARSLHRSRLYRPWLWDLPPRPSSCALALLLSCATQHLTHFFCCACLNRIYFSYLAIPNRVSVFPQLLRLKEKKCWIHLNGSLSSSFPFFACSVS